MKVIFLILGLAISFCFGFASKSVMVHQEHLNTNKMAKVTGIGGIFFKCKDASNIRAWYKAHLGMDTSQYGANFEWREAEDHTKKGATQWSPFNENTKYFEPSTKDFMINYRVDNLEALVAQLKNDGVTIVDKMETYDYGKFIHIIDVEGNKVELWEPIGN